MTAPLTIAVAVAAVALAGWAGWFVAQDRPVILRQLFGAAGVEALLVAQGAVAGVQLAGSASVGSPGLFWGYVAASLVILPFAALLAFAERTRWSSVVLAAAALTVAFLQLRLVQVWQS